MPIFADDPQAAKAALHDLITMAEDAEGANRLATQSLSVRGEYEQSSAYLIKAAALKGRVEGLQHAYNLFFGLESGSE